MPLRVGGLKEEEVKVSQESTKGEKRVSALLVIVKGIPHDASDARSEALLQEAESLARGVLEKQAVTEIPHMAAWRKA